MRKNRRAALAVLLSAGMVSSLFAGTVFAEEEFVILDDMDAEMIQTEIDWQEDFDEITVMDGEDYVVTITGYAQNGEEGFSLATHMENKTEVPCMIAMEQTVINGLMGYAFQAEELEAGASSDNVFTFEDVAVDGVSGDFTDLRVYFNVYTVVEDAGESYYDVTAREEAHFYPLGEEAAIRQERKAEATDVVLYEDDLLRVTAVGCDVDGFMDFYDFEVTLYLENKTDQEIYFEATDMTINGQKNEALDPTWGDMVVPQAASYSYLIWDPQNLLDQGIEKAEEFSFDLTAYPVENYIRIGDSLAQEIPVTYTLPKAFDLTGYKEK